MRTVLIYKAQPTVAEVENTRIEIIREVPDCETLERAGEYYKGDAALLCDTLYQVLPGGTFDRLLIEMMERRASHFKVPFE